MKNLINTFITPRKIFESLKEKPEWVTPFIIILVTVAITATLTIEMTKETMMMKQEEIMRERGLTDEQIEQAMKFAAGPFVMVTGAISAAIFTTIIFLLFALLLNIFIPLFGGIGAYNRVFSVICFSAMVIVPADILKLILIAITRSPYVSTSLALFVPNLAKESFIYQLLSGLDFFMFWEMILVSLGISITNEIKRDNAYIIVFIIWIASIFISIGFGMFRPH